MCTQARIPSGSRAEGERVVEVLRGLRVDRERAAGRAGRRAPRARLGRARHGSNATRAPCSASSASRTFSMRLALPSARSTAARPRPARTSARSPGPSPPNPFGVEGERQPRREVGLADELAAAAGDLDRDRRSGARPGRPRGPGALGAGAPGTRRGGCRRPATVSAPTESSDLEEAPHGHARADRAERRGRCRAGSAR